MAETHSIPPGLDPDGLSYFKDALDHSSCYLEYGCGGSTVYACNSSKVDTVISVDSDTNWIAKVKGAVTRPDSLHLAHCDIGEVGNWGRPTGTSGFRSYWKYMALPWNIAHEFNCRPDVVLIDGRFRVASFLYSLISARSGTTILFDDYLNRSAYFVVERYCALADRRGRMGIFIASRTFSIPDICESIAEYSVIPD